MGNENLEGEMFQRSKNLRGERVERWQIQREVGVRDCQIGSGKFCTERDVIEGKRIVFPMKGV